MKENGAPQWRQNPSVRPAAPSLPRPTGRLHLLQNLLFSSSFGSVSTALDGSRAGTGGTSTSPAPSQPRDARPLDAPVLVLAPGTPSGTLRTDLAEPVTDTGAEPCGTAADGPCLAGASPQTLQ